MAARETDLGGGLHVVRALPLRDHRLVGPWCFFDYYGPLSFTGRKVMDVAPHPHILQTVSWLFSGEVLHIDNPGCEGTVRPGGIGDSSCACCPGVVALRLPAPQCLMSAARASIAPFPVQGTGRQ